MTSAISRAEIELGLLLMPPGKRQEALSQAAWTMFDEDFAGRCLPFDEDAARHYASYRVYPDAGRSAHQRGRRTDRCDCADAPDAVGHTQHY